MSDQDDPHTKTLFRGTLQRRTCHELLITLGFDRSPSEMGVLSTVLTTALGALSREAKADVVQFLAAPQGALLVQARNSPWFGGSLSEPEGGPQCALCDNGKAGLTHEHSPECQARYATDTADR